MRKENTPEFACDNCGLFQCDMKKNEVTTFYDTNGEKGAGVSLCDNCRSAICHDFVSDKVAENPIEAICLIGTYAKSLEKI